MPTLHMMIGLPGSGKTTRAGKIYRHPIMNLYWYSTDAIIDNIAKTYSLTYNDIFEKAMNLAVKIADHNLQKSIEWNYNVVWDQTNLTPKQRKTKLSRFPSSHYEKIAYVCMPPEEEEWKRRLNSRPGKTIPEWVLEDMKIRFEVPTLAEGFDKIIEVS